MIVLALDSGIERTGYSIFDKSSNGKTSFRYIASGLLKTLKTDSTEERLVDLYNQLNKVVKIHKPKVMVVEQLFFFNNQKTAIKVSQAQGVGMLLAGQLKMTVEFLTPLQIKQIVTGYGNADKKAVQKMLGLQLGLTEELRQDDQADAIACGLAYCHLNKALI